MSEPVISLTYEQALSGLRKAVEEKGKDYRFSEGGGCTYYESIAEDALPRCIIGHVFAQHGLTPKSFGMSYDRRRNCYVIGTLVSLGLVEVDRVTLTLFDAVQQYQDYGIPWGQAVAKAERDTRYQHREWFDRV